MKKEKDDPDFYFKNITLATTSRSGMGKPGEYLCRVNPEKWEEPVVNTSSGNKGIAVSVFLGVTVDTKLPANGGDTRAQVQSEWKISWK